MAPTGSARGVALNDAGKPQASTHSKKIALADFDAVVPEQTVGNRGVEIEIRKHNVVEVLLPFQREGSVRARRKSNIAAFRAFEIVRA